MSEPTPTPFGFTWGPLSVTRIARFSPRKGREAFVVQVSTGHESIDIYVSKTGRSVRVFRGDKELS